MSKERNQIVEGVSEMIKKFAVSIVLGLFVIAACGSAMAQCSPCSSGGSKAAAPVSKGKARGTAVSIKKSAKAVQKSADSTAKTGQEATAK